MRGTKGMRRESKILLTALTCFALTFAAVVPALASTDLPDTTNTSTDGKYQIRIFAGNAGSFNVDECENKYFGAVVTADCIILSLSKNDKIPSLPQNGEGLIVYSDANRGKYYILNEGQAGAAAFHRNEEVITRSEDVTVQYGTLINGVEYSIKYIEQGTGIEIALPKIIFEEAGKEITETAPTIAGFTLASATSQTLKLVKNGTNVITFEYIRNVGDATYSETNSTEIIDGGVTTSFVETEVPTYVVTATAGGGGRAGGGAEVAGGVAEGGVEIPDADVPLADTPGSDEGINGNSETDQSGDEVLIEDQETPLSESPFASNTMWGWIIAIIGAGIFMGGGIYFIVRKKIKFNFIKK